MYVNASNTGSLRMLNFEPLGGTLVLYNSEGRASMQGCSKEAKLVLWSLQSSLHLPKAGTCTYLCLACQRNKSQYQSNSNPNFTMALLARVPPGVGPNIKAIGKQGCSSRWVRASQPVCLGGSCLRCGVAGRGRQALGGSGSSAAPGRTC